MPRRDPSDSTTLTVAEIEDRIKVIRGERVMLDSELAELYGVTTKRLNEQVRRNRQRFPDDFAFQLTQKEFTNLKSQIATSSSGFGGRRTRPWVFTEHGVAMLSSVLRSEQAVRVNIAIMRAFVRMRRLMATPGELVEQIQRLAEAVELHEDQIQAITQVLQQMVQQPTPAGKGQIGFQVPKSTRRHE